MRLESDQLTSVTLYRVGALGAFAAKEVELRPGTYTAIGSRDGYRDVRQTFTVRPGPELAADQTWSASNRSRRQKGSSDTGNVRAAGEIRS